MVISIAFSQRLFAFLRRENIFAIENINYNQKMSSGGDCAPQKGELERERKKEREKERRRGKRKKGGDKKGVKKGVKKRLF